MGLFDRFRKKVNQADEGNGFMAEEGSEIAEKAIADREQALRSMNQEDATPDEPTGEYSEWDEFDDDFTDPFSAPTNSKERKRAAREQANKKSKQPVSPPIRDPMDSTTGRRLAESEMTFEIDLS